MTKLIDIIGNISLFIVVFWNILEGLFLISVSRSMLDDPDENDTGRFGMLVGLITISSSIFFVVYFISTVWVK